MYFSYIIHFVTFILYWAIFCFILIWFLIVNISGQKGDDELAIQIMYLLYQLMCHPITGDYIIQSTGTVLFYFLNLFIYSRVRLHNHNNKPWNIILIPIIFFV